ncbi:MAG: Gfa-like protein [Parcubacteria bacterium C7867-004]|nr:MAG: Gfa-like protein [Parcubacteria bacterium C7867-004]
MKKETGGCHCGKVKYEVEIDLEKPVIACNCSHCQIQGLLLTFAPLDSFTLLSGEDNLTEYRFNTEKIQHLFCSTCGVESFGRGAMPDGSPTVAINVRSIDGIDLDTLTITPYDGKKL